MISSENPILVVGLGHMGGPYLRKLRWLGIAKDAIIGIDPNAETRTKEAQMFGVKSFATIDEAAPLNPKTAIIAAPSPLHRSLFEDCARIGVKDILTEKPLVVHASELEGLEALGLNIFVGYLINFSPAIAALDEFAGLRELWCNQVLAVWGKNWPGVNRPMGADLEEELIHPLVAGMHIFGHHNIGEIKPRVMGTFMPFVRPELLEQARSFGFGDKLNDTSLGKFDVEDVWGGHMPISIMSSFNFFEQRREIDVSLARGRAGFPEFKARLEFDIPGENHLTFDRLRIIDARSGELVHESTKSADKLADQLHSVLRVFAGGHHDPRLVDLEWGSQVVRLIDGALAI